MNIPFRKITSTPTDFNVSSEGVTLKGEVAFKERNQAILQAHLSGEISLTCDICAEDFATMLDEKIALLIANGIYEGFNDTLDVVEINETIDFDELLRSEVEMFKSDYHSCNDCKNKERN